MPNYYVEYKNPNHVANLNDMRLTGKLCDVTIEAEDRKIRAHKCILSANLKYFESMFVNPFREYKQDFVTMRNVGGNDLEAFIHYAYTGEIFLKDNNVLSLLEVADYLNEDDIKKACIDFLEQRMRKEDVFGVYKLATAIECNSLINAAKSRILSNFGHYSQSTEYLDLDFESLKDLLTDVRLKYDESQHIFFEGTIKWVRHNDKSRRIHVNDLLNLIKITDVNSHWLLKYVCRSIEDEGFNGILKDIIIFYNKTTKIMEREPESLILMGCFDYKLQFQSYDFIKKRWTPPHRITVSGDPYHHSARCAVIFRNKLYYTFRKQIQNGYSTHLLVFNPATKRSTVLSSESKLLSFSAMCAGDRFLYFCGGPNSDQVLRYDPQTNSFVMLPPMKSKRWCGFAIFYRGYLHVLGGSDKSSSNSVEKYDPATREWTDMPPMQEGRRDFSAAVLDGKLYACGGSRTNSVEVYDPDKNSWQLVASMNLQRLHFVLVAHEGKLVAIGGEGGDDRTVEVYDPSRNEWQMDCEFSSGLQVKWLVGGFVEGFVASSSTIATDCHASSLG